MSLYRRGTSYLYGITDEKYARAPVIKHKAIVSLVPTFEIPKCLEGPVTYDPNDVSVVFKSSPEKLVVLAALAVDKLPLPSVYNWTNMDVSRWILMFGYPEYRQTFRKNYINGRRLLMLDASTLSIMNIKDFDHIKHITAGIRFLYQLEKIKYYPEAFRTFTPYEHYKLYRLKTGNKYENTPPSKFFWQKKLLDEQPKIMTHWDMLSAWLRRIPPLENEIIVPYMPRANLHKCIACVPLAEPTIEHFDNCTCMPPCSCYWTEDGEVPESFSCLKDQNLEELVAPPYALSCLQRAYPERYVWKTFSFAKHMSLLKKKIKVCPCMNKQYENNYYTIITLNLNGQKTQKITANKF